MRPERWRLDAARVVLGVRRADVRVRENHGIGGVKGRRSTQIDLERDGLRLAAVDQKSGDLSGRGVVSGGRITTGTVPYCLVS
jgi:hypothetical protein